MKLSNIAFRSLAHFFAGPMLPVIGLMGIINTDNWSFIPVVVTGATVCYSCAIGGLIAAFAVNPSIGLSIMSVYMLVCIISAIVTEYNGK